MTTNGPERLTRSGGLGARLLASSRADRPPEASRKRALAMAACLVMTSQSKSAAAGWTASTLLKWAAVGMASVVGAVGVNALVVHRAAPIPTPSRAPIIAAGASHEGRVAPAALVEVGSAVTRSMTSREEPSLPAPRTKGLPSRGLSEPSHVAADTGRSASTLAPEIAALDAAKAAVSRHEPGVALARLDDYRRSFPNGLLAAEAAGLRIEALAQSGRKRDAEREFEAFRARYPASPLLDNVARSVDR